MPLCPVLLKCLAKKEPFVGRRSHLGDRRREAKHPTPGGLKQTDGSIPALPLKPSAGTSNTSKLETRN